MPGWSDSFIRLPIAQIESQVSAGEGWVGVSSVPLLYAMIQRALDVAMTEVRWLTRPKGVS